MPGDPEVLLVDTPQRRGEAEEPTHVDEDSEVFEPQAVLFLHDNLRRERLAQEIALGGFRSIQVDDLVTTYAVVTRLIPELILVDPSMAFDVNWRDLEALRKFTNEQDCAMMVLISNPDEMLVQRLVGLEVDHVSLCTDPVGLLALTIRRIVLQRREIRELRENSLPTA